MKLGIMQPYLFPYLGYFDLIHRTDRWIVFDVVGYHRRSWMNRNRILHPSRGWQYVTVPVGGAHRDTLISQVEVDDLAESRRRLLAQLEHYQHGRAPYFEAVRGIVERTFDSAGSSLLRDLCVSGLRETCRYLGIRFEPEILSQLALPLPRIEEPGEWALEIASLLGASEYINPPGGREIFQQEKWAERKIALTFTEADDFTYECGRYEFVPRLSILDVLMWNEPGAVKSRLDGVRNAS